jgi:MFS family permease
MWPAAQISRLAASCTLMLALSGSLLVPPVLYSAMAASAGVAQAHVTALMPAAYAVGSLTLTLPGSMFMERFGLRRSFVLGTTLQALFASIQVASVQLWQLVALQFAQGACHCFAGTVGFIAFCNAWFGEAPSTAIAVNFAAFGLAGVLWTPAAAAIAARFSWRAAIGAVAAVQWGVALPLAALCMRDPPPAAPKRRPSRVAREHGSGGADEARATWWVRDASIWLLALLSFCVLYVTCTSGGGLEPWHPGGQSGSARPTRGCRPRPRRPL